MTHLQFHGGDARLSAACTSVCLDMLERTEAELI